MRRTEDAAVTVRCLTSQRAPIIAWSWQDREWHRSDDIGPVLPARQLGQVVGAHEPHEPDVGEQAAQRAERVEGVARAEFGLEGGGDDASAIGDTAGAGEAVGKAFHARPRFQRVAGRDQKPDLVEFEPAARERGDMEVAGMGRVEGAAEEADAQPAPIAPARDRVTRIFVIQRRTWPVPRTT